MAQKARQHRPEEPAAAAGARGDGGGDPIDRRDGKLEARDREGTRRLRERVALLEEDEEAGRAVQARLLPPERTELAGFLCESLLLPSLYLSGDTLDYYPIDEDHLGFYLADVAGHGTGSALVAVLVNTFFKGLLRDLRQGGGEGILDPAASLARLNGELLHLGFGKHLTCFCGVLHRGDRRLRYAPGGHYPFPQVWHGEGRQVIETRGNAVGLFTAASYENRECILPEGFKLGLFSDGILELPGPAGEENKMDRLAAMGDDTRRAVREACTGAGSCLPDDVTFLTITEKG